MIQIPSLLRGVFVFLVPLLLLLTLQLTVPSLPPYMRLYSPSRPPHSTDMLKSGLTKLGFANSESSLSSSAEIMSKAPVIAVCHGGGPMPLLGDPTHKNMVESMKSKAPKVLGLDDYGKNEKGLRGIVIVTAHWIEETPTISSASKHDLYFDYGGFPKEAYQLKYPAPGSPEIAGMVYKLLSEAGFQPEKNPLRGWDHGVFVPLLLIHPTATIPVVQLSLAANKSPSEHYKLGQALAPLRSQGIAIIGSGMATFHNRQLMFNGSTQRLEVKARSKEFSDRLTSVLEMEDKSGEKKMKELDEWKTWTGSQEAHPKGGEEHFWPLIVCAGAGEGEKAKWWRDEMGRMMEQSTYYWD